MMLVDPRGTTRKKISREIEIPIDEMKRIWKDFLRMQCMCCIACTKVGDATREMQKIASAKDQESFHRAIHGNECRVERKLPRMGFGFSVSGSGPATSI
jgi:hypothetical protein